MTRSRTAWRGAASLAVAALCACGASAVSGCMYLGSHCWEEQTCDEGASALPPAPPPPASPCEGDPVTGPVLDGCGVFVRAQGDDRHPGTRQQPVRTLERAIVLAASGRRDGDEPTRRVYACGETFEETVALPSGVDLWGGRRCADGDWSFGWSFGGPDQLTTIAPGPEGIPVRVFAAEGRTSTIYGVRVVAGEGSASDGRSSIGMILSQGAKVRLVASEVHAAGGKDGEPGEDAPIITAEEGVYGNHGAPACSAERPVAAVTACDDSMESIGGRGGDGGLHSGEDGQHGEPYSIDDPSQSGRGGLGAGSRSCTDGQGGAHGKDGEHGADAAGAGVLDTSGWVGVRGADGDRGGIGWGGGGGGGSKSRFAMIECHPTGPQRGAAGGSGGGGGCGGRGGKGGGPGGASLGIVALEGAEITLLASLVVAGDGGDGGGGGRGQVGGMGHDGGLGGLYTPWDDWRACNGGKGGNGGRGGDGGGGLGGPSVGVATVGVTKVSFEAGAIVRNGHAGFGGSGSDPSRRDPGTAGAWVVFPAVDPGPPR
ncbi:hypothetical protein WME77_34655 [Sorangium sp. So ce764]|uniref:hypothetical protein n=1 Tax=Sorangium sp. So ce764 TaxID=3133320 RepID=UPI003F5FDBCD